MIIRRRKPRAPVERVAGGFKINLDANERALVGRLTDELRQLLLGPADDTLLRRMFPPAYHLAEDAEADEEYQRLMRDELVASRLDALNTVTTALAEEHPLDEATLTAFMQSINAVRLVLGTLLDVTEDDDINDLADDDPRIGEHHLYGYLSYLLDAAVRAAATAS